MSSPNEGFDYLYSQFKSGIATGAGLTLFVSGIFIGHKAAVLITNIAKDIGNNSVHSFRQKIHEIIIEEEDDDKPIIYR